MRAYIFDIDGTLADCSHRLHHIEKSPKDWQSFFAACAGDVPIAHMIQCARDLLRAGASVVYVSGRSDECRAETEQWLLDQGLLPGERLYMRKAGDYRNDDILKPELIEMVKADGFEPILAFEDRKRCVASLRAAGIPCAQVADGDF